MQYPKWFSHITSIQFATPDYYIVIIADLFILNYILYFHIKIKGFSHTLKFYTFVWCML